MQNLQLSNNVKQYFVNALKGLGLRDQNSPEELSSTAIANLLDSPNTTPLDIYMRIRLTVLQRLRNDAFTNKALQRDTAFDRKTVKLLLNNLNVDSRVATNIQNNADELLRDLSASGIQENGNITSATISHRGHVDEIVENVIVSLMAGVPEQNLDHDDPNRDEKQQAVDLWQEIRCAMFKRRLITTGHYDENKFNAWIKTGEFNEEYASRHQKFHIGRIRSDLIAEVKTRFLGNVIDSEAEAFLDTKIQSDELKQILNANEGLLEDCKNYCRRRCQAEQTQYDEGQITLLDVLAAAGSAKTQIITFFQMRSQEQKQDQIQNPKTTAVKKENKIGNVMGGLGRAYVKDVTGRSPAVTFDVPAKIKPGKKGPWRGFNKLFERIYGFTDRELLGNLQSIGTAMGLITRETGFSFNYQYTAQNDQEIDVQKLDDQDVDDLKQPWKTGFKDMPKEYYNEDGTLNLAGTFYNKTKARILGDKAIMVDLSTGANMESLSDKETKEYMTYLQNRIVTAELILQRGIPDPASPDFNNSLYYANLEKQILAEDENKKNKGACGLIKSERSANANANNHIVLLMNDVFANRGFTPVDVKLRREKAKILFNLEDKMQSSENSATDSFEEISNGDLDAMIQRLGNSGEMRKLYNDINNPTRVTVDSEGHIRDEFKLNAVDALSVISQFVENDLQQHAMKQEYKQYFDIQSKRAAEQKSAEDREKVKQYREQIHAEAIQEMDGGMTM